MRNLILTLVCIIQLLPAFSQQTGQTSDQNYQWPTDPLVQKKLEHWQDLKFGMIIHWGLYSVPGIVESWQLCSEDWVERDSTRSYEDFKRWYFGLKDQFNPVNFNPEQWAKTGKAAGMKYVVFTTKHHDGFCMFDTRQTDFKISTGSFQHHPKADVTRYIFDAFRKNNFMVGAYFSKPDWHSEYYWWPKYATADRNNNYDIRKYPWRWNQFKQYTFNQISELMNQYGTVDILWLDGGWVRPRATVNEEVLAWGARIPEWSQDIDMPSIASMARKAQPGILIVDRTVHGPFENYRTPEQRIPEGQLNYPWETCMTLGYSWGYIPGEPLKTSTQVIHSLIEIVAKGGSLLLGIGPKPDGTLDDAAVKRLEEIGKWTQKNGEGIYGTRATKYFRDGNIFFTESKNKDIRYALFCVPPNTGVPESIEWKDNPPAKGTRITLLETGERVSWTLQQGRTKVLIPSSVRQTNKSYPALVFRFSAGKQ